MAERKQIQLKIELLEQCMSILRDIIVHKKDPQFKTYENAIVRIYNLLLF